MATLLSRRAGSKLILIFHIYINIFWLYMTVYFVILYDSLLYMGQMKANFLSIKNFLKILERPWSCIGLRVHKHQKFIFAWAKFLWMAWNARFFRGRKIFSGRNMRSLKFSRLTQCASIWFLRWFHRLNMDFGLQSLFGPCSARDWEW